MLGGKWSVLCWFSGYLLMVGGRWFGAFWLAGFDAAQANNGTRHTARGVSTPKDDHHLHY